MEFDRSSFGSWRIPYVNDNRALMIIGDLNVKSIAFLPSKTYAVLIVDTDTVLSHAIAFQCLKPIRRW